VVAQIVHQLLRQAVELLPAAAGIGGSLQVAGNFQQALEGTEVAGCVSRMPDVPR